MFFTGKQKGQTPLHYAILCNNVEALEALLQHNASAETKMILPSDAHNPEVILNAPTPAELAASCQVWTHSPRAAALLRLYVAVQRRKAAERDPIRQQEALCALRHLPQSWTEVPGSLSTTPARDAKLIELVNSEMAFSRDVSLIGRCLLVVTSRHCGVRVALRLFDSLPLLIVIAFRIASTVAEGKHGFPNIMLRYWDQFDVAITAWCANVRRTSLAIHSLMNSNKQYATGFTSIFIVSKIGCIVNYYYFLVEFEQAAKRIFSASNDVTVDSLLELPVLRAYKLSQVRNF